MVQRGPGTGFGPAALRGALEPQRQAGRAMHVERRRWLPVRRRELEVRESPQQLAESDACLEPRQRRSEAEVSMARLNETRLAALLAEPFGAMFSRSAAASRHAEHGTSVLVGLDAEVEVHGSHRAVVEGRS
jgi:hypothetical protein